MILNKAIYPAKENNVAACFTFPDLLKKGFVIFQVVIKLPRLPVFSSYKNTYI